MCRGLESATQHSAENGDQLSEEVAYLQNQLLDLQHLTQDQDSELDKLRSDHAPAEQDCASTEAG